MLLNRVYKYVLILIIVGVIAAVATALAASNTVPAGNAGEGAGTVSGFTVTSVHYNLNATDPNNIDAVTFTISPAANTVKIQLVTGGAWYSCSGTTSISCATTSPQAAVNPVNNLDVVAAQ